MKNWMISGLCWWGLLTGCQTKDGIRRLAPHDFEEALTTDSIAVCLDVRKPSEFAAGHLAGAASLNVLDTLAFEADLDSLDKTKRYYLYCKSGKRSHNAALWMRKVGFEVIELRGGFQAWEKAGKPIETD